MSKTRDKYISMRVDEGIYNEVKKRADSAGQTVSDYMLGVVEDMLDGDKDIILLLRNTYEEVLKLGDMLSLMMGYNTEAYTTMLSRISVNLTEAQLKTSKERRESISKGLRKYGSVIHFVDIPFQLDQKKGNNLQLRQQTAAFHQLSEV